MRRVVPDLELRVDGRLVGSETTYATVGAYVVVLATAVPELGVTLTCAYIGAQDAPSIAVDLLLGQRPAAHNAARALERELVPVTYAHDRCLLDHAAQLQGRLAALGAGAVTVDVGDAALAALAAGSAA